MLTGAMRGWIAFGALALLLVGSWGLYAKGARDGRAEVRAEWDKAVAADKAAARRDERRAQDLVNHVGARVASEIAKIRIEHTTITRTIRDEIKTVPVYSECILTDRVFDGLNRLRAATDPGAGHKPEPAMPGAATARGADDGGAR